MALKKTTRPEIWTSKRLVFQRFSATLLPLNLKAAPLLDPAQQAKAKVDLVHDMRVHFHQPLQLRLNPDLPRQGVIHASLIGRRGVSRVGLERKPQVAVRHAVVGRK